MKPELFSAYPPKRHFLELLTGREREIDLVRHLARPGSPPVLVRGGAGSGKTTLLRSLGVLLGDAFAFRLHGAGDLLSESDVNERLFANAPLPDGHSDPMLAFDDYDALSASVRKMVASGLSQHRRMQATVVTSGLEFDPLLVSYGTPVIDLDPLRSADLLRMIEVRASMAEFASHRQAEEWVRSFWTALETRVDPAGLSPKTVLTMAHRSLSMSTEAAIDLVFRDYEPRACSLVVQGIGDRLKPLLGTLEEELVVSRGQEPSLLVAPFVAPYALQGYFRRALNEFEELINTPNIPERRFQDFFESHPEFLQGVDCAEVVPSPMLVRRDDGPLIPDFVMRPFSPDLGEILDLKTPDPALVVGGRNRLRFSQKVQDGLAQLRKYHLYFSDSENRNAFRRRYGFGMFEPRITLVIGRTPRGLDEEAYQELLSGLGRNARVLNYDQIFEMMKARAARNIF